MSIVVMEVEQMVAKALKAAEAFLARAAGSARAANMVVLGAGSPFLNLPGELLERAILNAFRDKGEKIQTTNIAAFRAGKAAGAAYRACLTAGLRSREARVLVGRLEGGVLADSAIPSWKQLLSGNLSAALYDLLASAAPGRFSGIDDVPRSVLAAGDAALGQLPSLLFKATKT